MVESQKFSGRLASTKRERTEAMDDVVNTLRQTPEYQAYEGKVVYAEQRGNQYISASHPYSEVDTGSRQQDVQREQEAIRTTEAALRRRVESDGIPRDQIGDVMGALQSAAAATAESQGRCY